MAYQVSQSYRIVTDMDGVVFLQQNGLWYDRNGHVFASLPPSKYGYAPPYDTFAFDGSGNIIGFLKSDGTTTPLIASGTVPTFVQLAAPGGAALIGNAPAGGITSSTVQAALNELDTKKVPFVALAASTGAGLIGWIQSGVGAIFRWVRDKLRESVSAADYGALNDGLQASAAANTTAIQAAVDAMNLRGGGEVKIGGGGVYYVGVVNYFLDAGGASGITSIKMKDNVSIFIEQGTTIKLIDSAYGAGAYYRMFSSRDGTRLSNAKIYGGGTIDGNIANQIVNADNNASNIQLECLANVTVTGIRSINAKGMGIQLRGVSGGANMTGIVVTNNLVDNVKNIGIQCSSFSGLVISGNNISSCTNNGIDIYGDNGTATCQSKNFAIYGNTVDTALTGTFCETVRNGTVTGNTYVQCTYGLIVNRINGQPRGLVFSGNSTLTCPTGMRVTGDTGGVSVRHNTFSDFSVAGVALATGATGNVSYVDVSNNYFIPTNNTTQIISVAGNVASFNTGRDNTVNSSGITLALLYSNSALSSVVNSFGGFRVLPVQVGPDAYGELAQFTTLTLVNGAASNVAGPVAITILDNTGGDLTITARQGGIGQSRWRVPYVKYAGVMTLGTPIKAINTADPITSITVVGGNMQANLVAANSYLQWGLEYTPFA